MSTPKSSGRTAIFARTLLLLTCWLAVGVCGEAQQGQNAVWISGSARAASSAFLDASSFCGTPGACSSGVDDFCAVLYAALHALSTSSFGTAGGVIDARGVIPSSTKATSCTGSPFVSGTSGINIPSTILLPAGIIPLGKTWVLPNGTKILGQGAGSPYSGTTTGLASITIIQAKGGFSGNMIQMGPSATGALNLCSTQPLGFCTGVAIENLALQGGTNGANVSGILNGQSQDMSYVHRVSMYQIGMVGLKVQNNAQNSGPYSEITFDNGGLGSSSTECAELDVSTRGIRGLVCNAENITSAVAVNLNSSNNFVKDVQVQGFKEGIQVQSGVSSAALFNITGGSGVTDVVHLASSTTTRDISIMGVSTNGSMNSILDEVTLTSTQPISDSSVALYVLGESTSIGNAHVGYSRFTTSTNPNVATWGAGTSIPSGICANKGSLFSATGGTGDLYVCNGSWQAF